MYTNHDPFQVPPEEWPDVVEQWVTYMQDPDYVRVDGKLIFVILNTVEMRRTFGGPDGVRAAFDLLRQTALRHGLPGVFVVGGVNLPPAAYPMNRFPDLAGLPREGYDALSQYAYPWASGIIHGAKPYSDLVRSGEWIWEQFSQRSGLPYIADVMAGWDPRPWNERDPWEGRLLWFERTPEQFGAFVRAAIEWAYANARMQPEPLPAPPLIFIEAWNEYGEGSYIAPTVGDGHRYGNALAQALSNYLKMARRHCRRNHRRAHASCTTPR